MEEVKKELTLFFDKKLLLREDSPFIHDHVINQIKKFIGHKTMYLITCKGHIS